MKTEIIQYDLNMNPLNEYESIGHAASLTGIERNAISNNLIGATKTCGGYVWKYKKETKRCIECEQEKFINDFKYNGVTRKDVCKTCESKSEQRLPFEWVWEFEY